MLRFPLLGLGFALVLAGQTPPVPSPSAPAASETPQPPLQNTGKAMLLEYRCTDDDIQWAGLTCSEEEPCPLYLEISAAEAVGNRIFAVGNIHSKSTTLYSVLVASEDAGKTWREAYERLRGASLDHIQFIDFETGWISGETVNPLPQDPFLLITSDGGKSWRRRPVFSESKPGSIVQFWFGSRNSGALIIDREQSGDGGRYELYETPNAGETWMIREVTDKLPKIRRGNANTDWRIRADAPTKSFHIERNAGDRWRSIAAFSVPLGGCKPGVRTEPPAPAEELPKPEPAPERKPPTLKKGPGPR